MFYTYTLSFQISKDIFTVWVCCFVCQLLANDRDDDNLKRRYSRRHNETFVISVYHYHHTDCSGRQTP